MLVFSALQQTKLFIVVVCFQKKRKKNFANSEDRRKLVRHVLTLSHLGQARQENKRRERGGDGGRRRATKLVLKQFAKRILNDF